MGVSHHILTKNTLWVTPLALPIGPIGLWRNQDDKKNQGKHFQPKSAHISGWRQASTVDSSRRQGSSLKKMFTFFFVRLESTQWALWAATGGKTLADGQRGNYEIRLGGKSQNRWKEAAKLVSGGRGSGRRQKKRILSRLWDVRKVEKKGWERRCL